ncbi:MAG TPA: FUSC family protein [Burkholderiaceae bacterium]|nr:FUSC family protein [Burkholderiaceae bacterium]
MSRPFPSIERFLFSHHLLGGVRQALGVLLPPLILGGLFGQFSLGLTAAIGAACVAILDQPGGPRRYGLQGMAAAVLLGSLTVAATGLAGVHYLLLWVIIPLLCFVFSMFTVFGKQGGLLGFACMLIMTLTMKAHPALDELWRYTLYSLGGGLFYFLYSAVVHKLTWHKEEQQTLSAALFATADYMRARSALYDVEADLDTHYRKMVRAQLAMTEAQQAARDTVLRELPTGNRPSDRTRAAALNLFIDMVALLDTLVASHTDYVTLRGHFGEADTLLFPRDALRKLAANLERIAMNVVRNRRQRSPHSLKPELRALEFDLRELREQGFAKENPEVYALLLQVLRRLRRANDLVLRMADNTRRGKTTELVDQRLEKALDRFLSRRKWRFGMLTSNLRLDSSHFRYAVRVMVAAALGMTLSTLVDEAVSRHLLPDWEVHQYWVLLTILVIMKPGFVLTRQRNGWRLTGTLIGCALALLIFNRFDSPYALVGFLFLSGILWYALLQVHFMLAAAANTVFVLLAFHFMGPQDAFVIGERVVDTLLASGIALLCSYFVLPWWESNYMASLAAALQRANLRFLRSGLRYAELNRQLHALSRTSPENADALAACRSAQHDAEMQWRVDRKNVHIAFSNFAGAFYRMMAEPEKRQRNVKTLNLLMIQHHTLASHISASIPLLAEMETVPEEVQEVLRSIEATLAGEDTLAAAVSLFSNAADFPLLAYPLRQMQSAATLIAEAMPKLHTTPVQEADTAAAAGSEAVPPSREDTASDWPVRLPDETPDDPPSTQPDQRHSLPRQTP